MKISKKILIAVFSVIAMTVLILDFKTALSGADQGISICLKTVIPSLFPFFFLSSVISSLITGRSFSFLRPIGRLCRIPEGSEALLVIGLIGGYPVGARTIREAYDSGSITKNDAERMLGFCNNPGPSFLFGMAGALFESALIPAIIYGVVIMSSVMTGFLLPGGSEKKCKVPSSKQSNPLINALYATAKVCGWVILFRIVLSFLEKWFFWLLPKSVFILLSGLLELSNGCIALEDIENHAARFIMICSILTFGGVCVGLQTVSVSGKLSCKNYFIGKVLQTGISICLSLLLSLILFPGNIHPLFLIFAALIVVPAVLLRKVKNNTGNYCTNGV